MTKFIAGVITGIVICTVGVSGVSKIFDNMVGKVQEVTRDAAR